MVQMEKDAGANPKNSAIASESALPLSRVRLYREAFPRNSKFENLKLAPSRISSFQF
jgi:hypothetical protein